MLSHIETLIKKETCVGDTCQNICFYVLLIVLLIITYLQLKEPDRQKKTKALAGTEGCDRAQPENRQEA